MSSNKKYAMLDTDFIFKSHIARNKHNHVLIDFVLEFKDYEFYCHEQIVKELNKHSITPNPIPWLKDKINNNIVYMYSDRDILQDLTQVYGQAATDMYRTMLKISCDTFNSGFYNLYYSSLDALETNCDSEVFLQTLEKCDNNIPPKNGLGEKKTYVLIQMMQVFHNGNVYLFCSDDFQARQSLSGLQNPVYALSILGVFFKLMKSGRPKEEMQEYYDHLSAFLVNQKEYKVLDKVGLHRIKVPMQNVLDDIYDGKFQLLRNGDLQYIK
ncbi:MAG: hypothetical protein SOW80_01580 [Anaerovoracaceae bacterium]|nr:hypothetical protein [Anaerovoracaceae bacterium]MDY4582909.1 hypothetical protein [Candidatus Faecousia sp.]